MSFAKCEHHECDTKDTCVRYVEAKESVVDYKHICTNYEWYIPIVTSVQTKQDEKKDSK